MGGNTGVRRDVLRWLVALSLSFPIKNIKRDFSNGFLVAEIFSRYFPHDIQMHSYDYGTKMEKKRDNWTQLQKIFKKRSFVVLKDEIETIISCQTPDGAGYLLERMYKFLTMKRCKPEEAEAEKKQVAAQQEWKQQQQATTNSEVATIPSVPVSARVEFVSQFSQRVEVTTTAAAADQRTSVVCSCTRSGPPCLNAACQHFITRVSTSYQSSGVLLPLQSNSVRFSSCGVYNEVDNSSPPKTRIDCRSDEENIQEKDKGSGLSAVERARQREAPPTAAAAADPVGKPIGRKTTTSDAVALAFRSPHRQRKFKQYTINDYRLQQTAGCVQLGKLGPDLEDEELGEKRERLERMKNFGRIVRSCNTAQVSVPKKTKTPPLSKRQKALEFAAMVPKPKVKVKVEVEKPATPEKNPHQLSALEILQAKHAADTQHVEAMRRELEIFLR